MSITYTKTMPTTTSNSSNRDSSFALGRKAFTNNIALSHQASNVNKNLDYSAVSNKKSSNVYAKPVGSSDQSTRIQRLRLSNTGSGSMKLKNDSNNSNDSTDSVNFAGYYKITGDVNNVNSALSRVRGGGYIAPKKKHTGCSR